MRQLYVPFALLAGMTVGLVIARIDATLSASKTSYTAETFTPDLTIRIQYSGDCDLAAMIAEAREAAGK